MKTAAFFVLSALAILTADPAPETGPNFNEESRRELPYPLPADFNECVSMTPTEKGRREFGLDGRFYQWDPPLSDTDKKTIQTGIALGWGVFRFCTERAS